MNQLNYIEAFRKEIERKMYRQESIKNYISCVTKFLFHFSDRKDPKYINEQDIKDFLAQFKEHNTQRGYHSAIKCFYKYVCRQPNKFKYIEYCRKNNKLPIVLSVEEMQRLIFACSNIKHKTIICLMYSTGMRVGEVIDLKIDNLDSDRMVINVLNAKGGKDRQVTLDPLFLELVKAYINQYQPKEYLFNGQFDLQYSERSISQFLQKYADLAGIKKRVYPHLIRHCYATHQLEAGQEMSIIQKVLGHGSIKTTQIYAHISNNLVSRIRTPLQGIVDNSKILLP